MAKIGKDLLFFMSVCQLASQDFLPAALCCKFIFGTSLLLLLPLKQAYLILKEQMETQWVKVKLSKGLLCFLRAKCQPIHPRQ